MVPNLPLETTGRYPRPSAPTRIGCQYLLEYCGPEDPDDDESEALSLELDVCRIDYHIKQLQQGKKNKLRRLNTLRSTTRILPPEILALIFHHVATPITYSTFLDYCRKPGFPKYMERNISIIRCASVCSFWRDLILSTPSLWTTLVLNVRPDDRKIRSPEMVELSWARSQELPLTVDLGFKGSQESGGVTWEVRAIELFSLVRSNAERLSMLRLRSLPISQVHHIIKSSLHQLQCLSLENMGDSRAIALSNLPQLRQLILRSIWSKIRVAHSMNNITVLDFFDTSLAVCIGVFKHCPNVVEVHCRFPRVSQDVLSVGSGSIITFPFLENLTWTLSDDRVNSSFIQQLALPALKVLQLYGDMNHTHSIGPQPIIQFFNQLSRNLQELELVNWREWTSGGLAQLFGTVHNTKKLVLRDCFETFNLDMVKLLTLTQIDFVNRPDYLPHLETLSVQSAKTRAYLEMLPNLMKQRALGSIETQPFSLEISRPGASTVQLLEAEAAFKNGHIKLKFLEGF